MDPVKRFYQQAQSLGLEGTEMHDYVMAELRIDCVEEERIWDIEKEQELIKFERETEDIIREVKENVN